MTLDEIKKRLAAEKRLYSAVSKKMPRGITDAEKLIEWLERALPHIKEEAEVEQAVSAALKDFSTPATELLREINGENK